MPIAPSEKPTAGASLPVPALSGSGSPVGVKSATAIGQFYIDTAGGYLWIAGSVGTGNWIAIGGQIASVFGLGVQLVAVSASTNGDFFQIVDSTGVKGFSVDDSTDNGTTFSKVATHLNTLDDGTADAVATFTTTINLAAIPTADPHVAGQLYSVAGVVHVSAG